MQNSLSLSLDLYSKMTSSGWSKLKAAARTKVSRVFRSQRGKKGGEREKGEREMTLLALTSLFLSIFLRMRGITHRKIYKENYNNEKRERGGEGGEKCRKVGKRMDAKGKGWIRVIPIRMAGWSFRERDRLAARLSTTATRYHWTWEAIYRPWSSLIMHCRKFCEWIRAHQANRYEWRSAGTPVGTLIVESYSRTCWITVRITNNRIDRSWKTYIL